MGSELNFKLGDLLYGVVRFLGKRIERGFENGISPLELSIIELEASERRIGLIVSQLKRNIFIAPVRILNL